jgi:hypothetical protein
MCDGKDNNCNGIVDEECFCMDTWALSRSWQEIEGSELPVNVGSYYDVIPAY